MMVVSKVRLPEMLIDWKSVRGFYFISDCISRRFCNGSCCRKVCWLTYLTFSSMVLPYIFLSENLGDFI
jgi:hypothetical protein